MPNFCISLPHRRSIPLSVEAKESSYQRHSWCQPRGVRLNVKRSSPTFCIFLQNATAGTRITIINATDKDVGRNAEIKFTIISGNDDGKFLLNETSGELFTAGILDYDTTPNSYKVN